MFPPITASFKNPFSSTCTIFQPWRRFFCDHAHRLGFRAAGSVNGSPHDGMAEMARALAKASIANVIPSLERPQEPGQKVVNIRDWGG